MPLAMSYAAAIEQLNAMTPELYTRAGHPRHKFSLDEIRILLAELDDPQKRFPAVLIAGTNGKGSTAATLASILCAAGLRTGLYTSPHLERANERIRVDGVEIDDDAFAHTFFLVLEAAHRLVEGGRLPQFPSYFEILTAQAFLHFAEARAEIAVLEVGMGGRLDATNVVDPLLSVITDISLDHMEWLGSTIAEIAREKAGVLRRGGIMVTLPQHPEANQVLGEAAMELDVRGVSAVPYMPAAADAEGAYHVEALGAEISVDSPLKGAHQHRNLALAIAAAVELKRSFGFPVTPAAIEAGIQQTRWPGRLEQIEARGVEWILDVAHNPAGVWALRAGLRTMLKESPLHALVFRCLRDKPLAEMAQILFPLFDEVILAPMHAARAASIDDLLAAAQATGTRTRAAASVREALRVASERARSGPKKGAVVISGSVYLVGEARGILLREKSGQEGKGAGMRRRPNPVPRFHRWCSNAVQAPAIFMATAFFGSLALLVSLFDKTGRAQHRIAQAWARACVRLSGARVTVRGAEKLSAQPVAVYAANHTSYMDTPVVFASLPFQFRILARQSLWQWAFIGWYLNRSGQIPINTENTHATRSSLGVGVRALRAGMPLFVFPEGGRTPTGALQPFLAGAAYMAIRAQVPLVPIALDGVYDLLPIHTHHFFPGEVTLCVGEPIATVGMTVRQTEELTERLKAAIEAMLQPAAVPAEAPARAL